MVANGCYHWAEPRSTRSQSEAKKTVELDKPEEKGNFGVDLQEEIKREGALAPFYNVLLEAGMDRSSEKARLILEMSRLSLLEVTRFRSKWNSREYLENCLWNPVCRSRA